MALFGKPPEMTSPMPAENAQPEATGKTPENSPFTAVPENRSENPFEYPNPTQKAAIPGIPTVIPTEKPAATSPSIETKPERLNLPELQATDVEEMHELYNRMMTVFADIGFQVNRPENQAPDTIKKLSVQRDEIRDVINRMLALLRLGLPFGKITAVNGLKTFLDRKILEAAYQADPADLEKILKSFSRELGFFKEINEVNSAIEKTLSN
jgi:hypothetical protein